jgi:hypothetical protein
VDLALLNDLNYTGLDFSANKILMCRKKLEPFNEKGEFKAECSNILDFLD